MNKKMMTLGSTLALILATSASAQMISILPGGRGNLYIGTPTTLPGPMGRIAINPRISLPSPLLAPSIAMAPAVAPAPVPAIVPVPVLPSAPVMPLPISAIPEHMWKLSAHDNVTLPYAALRANLSAPAAAAKDAPSAKDAAASRETLDNLFDGRDEKNSPVRSDRHQSLPEHDLESEIGAY